MGAALNSHRVFWERSQNGPKGNPNSVNISLTTGERERPWDGEAQSRPGFGGAPGTWTPRGSGVFELATK